MEKTGDAAGEEGFAEKVLSAMRFEFGGYVEHPTCG
jgi:6-phosphogluconate dehydrogenase (decarboxylating)